VRINFAYVDGILSRERAESLVDDALAWLAAGLREASEDAAALGPRRRDPGGGSQAAAVA
jgi:hypothetical protein